MNGMKRLLFFVLLLIAACSQAQVEKIIPPLPNPQRLVNDYTKTLTPDQVQALEEKLETYNDSTSTQIAVVIMQTVGDYPLEDVALGILRTWGVGGKEHSNGVVILVAKDDHKVRIETGYGLEGAIPDVTAKSIINNSITPNFREGNYYRGLDMATSDIIKAAAGEYKAPAGSGKKKSSGRGVGIGALFIIMIIIFSIIGGGGRGRGGMISRRGFGDIATGMILGSLLGGGRGGGGGGGWSGGGGGGFGGFGGGSGGGGGASGSW